MKVKLEKIRTKDLVVGKFYILEKSKSGFFSLGLYLGRDIRNYFCFYTVLQLRFETTSGLRFIYNDPVNFGSDELWNYYKEVIIGAMHNYNINGVVSYGTTQGIFNNIELGIDTNAFIEKYGIKNNNNVKLVSKSNLDKNTLYLSVTMAYCLRLKEDFFKQYSYYNFYKYSFYDYREEREIYTQSMKYYSIPKMLAVKDVLRDKDANELFKKSNPKLYDWVMKNLDLI